MAENIPFIYDKIFKRILTLSSKAVTNLINGLFGTNYPEDSKITYNWTEFEDDSLRKTLADTILTINGSHSYHMEAQMENDADIVFRVFEYSFHHANRNHDFEDNRYLLHFPEPKIIYLYSEKEIPEKYTLRLQFDKQQFFDYQVSTLNLLNTSTEELNEKKLTLLIPFLLLKLRKQLSQIRTPETIKQLHELVTHDILDSINKNVTLGNISRDDSVRLMKLTGKLLHHLYDQYPETKEVRQMYDQSIILDVDPYIDQIEELTEQLSQQKEQLSQKDEQLSQKEAEIARLKAELEKRN